MRAGLLRTVQLPDDVTNRFQANVRAAIETLTADDDLLNVPITSLIVTGVIPAGKSVVMFRGGPSQTLTLPLASSPGKSTAALLVVGNPSVNPVTLVPSATNTIAGGYSMSIAPRSVTLLISDGVSVWLTPDVVGVP